MSRHFYVNNLVVLPLESSELARKKVQTPFYIPCSCHMLYRYIICFTDSICLKEFSQFLNRYNEYIFGENCSHNFYSQSLVGTSANFRRVTRTGKWLFHLRPDKNLHVLPKHLALEDGWVPCGDKTVSTRAHIRKVLAYLCKTTLQVELCSWNLCLWTHQITLRA
jgi:hypothetical protein